MKIISISIAATMLLSLSSFGKSPVSDLDLNSVELRAYCQECTSTNYCPKIVGGTFPGQNCSDIQESWCDYARIDCYSSIFKVCAFAWFKTCTEEGGEDGCGDEYYQGCVWRPVTDECETYSRVATGDTCTGKDCS